MFSRDLTILPAHPHVQFAIRMSHTCLGRPSYSWYSFIDPEGWKAELAWVAGYIVRQFTCRRQSPIWLHSGRSMAHLHSGRCMAHLHSSRSVSVWHTYTPVGVWHTCSLVGVWHTLPYVYLCMCVCTFTCMCTYVCTCVCVGGGANGSGE